MLLKVALFAIGNVFQLQGKCLVRNLMKMDTFLSREVIIDYVNGNMRKILKGNCIFGID